MSIDFEPLHVALSVARVLDRCGLRYVVGGSLASSVSGEPRSTLDVDLVVAISAADVEPLVAALGDGFHADAEALRSGRAPAVERERVSSGHLHEGGPVRARRIPARRTGVEPPGAVAGRDGPERFLYVYTPEDIVLQKLRWYRLGGEVSDRQWRDVLGIVAVQQRGLDEDYLRRGADLLAVADLLERALLEGRKA